MHHPFTVIVELRKHDASFTHTILVIGKAFHKIQPPWSHSTPLVSETTWKRSMSASRDTHHSQGAFCHLWIIRILKAADTRKEYLLCKKIYGRGKLEKALSKFRHRVWTWEHKQLGICLREVTKGHRALQMLLTCIYTTSTFHTWYYLRGIEKQASSFEGMCSDHTPMALCSGNFTD